MPNTAARSRCLNCGGDGKYLGVFRDCSGCIETKHRIWHCEECGAGSGRPKKGDRLMTIRGKRPTRKQKQLLQLRRLDPANWLIIKNLLHEGELHIKNRQTGRERVIRCC